VIKLILVIFVFLMSSFVKANVYCNNVKVKINTSEGSGYHNFSDLGVKGSFIFISIPPESCSGNGSDSLKGLVYLVVDGMDDPSGIKKYWTSMFLSAEARGGTISFSAQDLGINSRNFQLLDPYQIKLD